MENENSSETAQQDELQPLPYHSRIVAYLIREEADLWKWFSSNKVRKEQGDSVRLDLLKSTYRLEESTHSRIYQLAREVLEKLNLKIPVTFYQANNASGVNAALAYVPNEAHIILMGSVLTALSESETKAMLGHELAHFILFERDDGEFLAASEILQGLSNDAAAQPCHRETCRLFRLYSEIFADRGAYAATLDPLVTISSLLKIETGLAEVSPESYLLQAEEILGNSQPRANQLTHPETYIRAKAVALFAEKRANADAEVRTLLEGSPALDELDLLAQSEVAGTTRGLVNHFLAPRWIQTEPVLAHARSFFPDFSAESAAALEAAKVEAVRRAHSSLQDYYAYVLLDFVAVDRQLEESPLAAGLLLSEQLGLRDRFGQIALRELAISKKRFAAIERDAEKIVQRANSTAKEI